MVCREHALLNVEYKPPESQHKQTEIGLREKVVMRQFHLKAFYIFVSA